MDQKTFIKSVKQRREAIGEQMFAEVEFISDEEMNRFAGPNTQVAITCMGSDMLHVRKSLLKESDSIIYKEIEACANF